MSETGLYLYCFSRPEIPRSALEGRGVDETGTLFLQPHRAIAAVLSEVRLDAFTGPEAEARMKDLAWLTPRVLRHEEIVERVQQVSPVLPTPFGTIFSSAEAVGRLLATHHDTVVAFLERTRGAHEWGVKLYLDGARAKETLLGEALAAQAPGLAASPGTRYLQERRLRAEADGVLQRWLDETSTRIRETLSPRAWDAVERRLLASTPAEHPGEMVANWAFLVPDAELDQFRNEAFAAVRPFAPRGLSVELAGPFPPYSFTPPLAA